MVDPIEETKKIDQKKRLQANLLAQQEAEKALQKGEIAGRKVTTTPTSQSDKIDKIAKKQQPQKP